MATACDSPARTRDVARSRIGTRCCTIKTASAGMPASGFRCNTSKRTSQSSRLSIRSCPKKRCSGSNMAMRPRSPTGWSCGKRSSGISPTAREFRKPLIVMSPKSLLRHKAAVSTLDEFAEGQFNTVIGETEKLVADNVRRVIVCSGKVYYDLIDYRRENKIADIAIIRLEQQYPFPHADFKANVAKYPNAKEVVWCQEEPQNQGAWYRLRAYQRGDIADAQVLAYAGRTISASPAVGYMSKHLAQQKQLIEDAFAETLASGEMVTAH